MPAVSPELQAIFWEAMDHPSEAERRAFLELCRLPKTQQRMLHFLQKGRPLMN